MAGEEVWQAVHNHQPPNVKVQSTNNKHTHTTTHQEMPTLEQLAGRYVSPEVMLYNPGNTVIQARSETTTWTVNK